MGSGKLLCGSNPKPVRVQKKSVGTTDKHRWIFFGLDLRLAMTYSLVLRLKLHLAKISSPKEAGGICTLLAQMGITAFMQRSH